MVGTKLLNSYYVDNDQWEYWQGYIIIRTVNNTKTIKTTIKTTKYGYFYRKTTDPCFQNNIDKNGTIIVLDYQKDEWDYIGYGFCQSESKEDDVTVLYR
jgi:hypothetical protein